MNCRLAGAALAAALLFSGQALADDTLMLGGAVDESELAGERGTSGIAIQITDSEQNVNNSIDINSGGGDVSNVNGDVMFGAGARTGNFSITAINTGNNAAMNNTFAVNLYFD